MDDLNDLLQQIAQIGPLQQRYALGQQFMQPQEVSGRNVGGTYVGASPLEHLANAVRQIAGAGLASSALRGQAQTRASFNKALGATGGQTVAGDYGEPIAGVGADPQAAQRLLVAGASSGDPGLQHAASTMLQERHLGVQEQQMQNLLRHQLALENQGQQKIGLTAAQTKTILDPYGKPITVKTHALPGAIGMSTGGGGGGTPSNGLSPEAIDKFAEGLALTGKMPEGVPKGRAGAASTRDITNRMMELYPDVNMAENKAGYIANTNSLRKMQQTADSIDAFENTALKNARMMLDSAKGIVDTGSPLLNKPLRYIQQKMSGDPKMAQFNAARQVAVQEIGKVLGGAVAGGTITDSQRHEVEGLISGDMTIPQMEATLQTLEADMANRKLAAQAGLDAIRGRMGGKKQEAPAAPPQQQQKQIVKYQQNKARGVKRAVYSDGSYGPDEPL